MAEKSMRYKSRPDPVSGPMDLTDEKLELDRDGYIAIADLLAELQVTDKKSPNFRLVDDYAVWLVNNR